jgi:hypothetical protein
MNRRTLATLVFLALPLTALAQSDDEDVAFEQSVRNFGFVSGAAHQCADEKDRPSIEAATLKAFSGLVRLFGSDDAFFYAAAFGAGSTMQIDKSKCAEYAASFKESFSKHGTNKDEAPK